MCGFVAIAGPGSCRPGVIEKSVRALEHRGPDGQGVWRAPDGGAALGHARLAILDLSPAGAQPMASADGRGVLTFNGEVYNFRELAAESGLALRSRSDTEVLVELLRAEGLPAVRRLRGMFGFAYWDGDELVVARDRLGIKPVFYAPTPGGLVVASELGAVLAALDARPEVDLRAVDDYLAYLYVPPPRTGYRGVFALPPAHTLRWSAARGVTVERYWQPAADEPSPPPDADEVRSLLEDAVRSHMVSDVPVGVFLSGGLDSSTLTAFAAKHSPGRLRTFTVTFGDEGRYLDERGLARQMAERFGTDHTEIPVKADVAEILPALARHFGQPFGNPTAVLSYALSRETRKHVKVALAGDGGDEVFGGYPRYAGLALAERWRRLPPAVRGGARAAVERFASFNTEGGYLGNRLRRFVGAAEMPPEATYFRWLSYLDAPAREGLFVDRRAALAHDPPAGEHEFLAEIRARGGGRRLADLAGWIDTQSFLPENVLQYGDRMSMAHGLEVRVPLCDHPLVDRVGPMPLSLKNPGGVSKGLLRWALRRDLPASVLAHRKMGFNPPLGRWLRSDLGPLLEDYLGERAVRDRGIFRPEAVGSMRAAYLAGRSNDALTLWSLVVLEAWMRQP